MDEKSCKNALACYIGYVMVKDLSYTKNKSVNPLCLINKTIGYVDESNGSKCLTVVPTDESKSTKKYTTKSEIL